MATTGCILRGGCDCRKHRRRVEATAGCIVVEVEAEGHILVEVEVTEGCIAVEVDVTVGSIAVEWRQQQDVL